VPPFFLPEKVVEQIMTIEKKPQTEKSRGDFFGVDIATYHAVCDLGDPDIAAGYLILAAGTGADNQTSTWSREAINQRTSLTWRRADKVVKTLIEKGFASWARQGARPRLTLHYKEMRQKITPKVQKVVEKIQLGGVPEGPSEMACARQALNLGYLAFEDGEWSELQGHKLTWLPKSFVEWNDDDRPPVERVRRGRDPEAFRLLIDLYADQDLAELGGTSRCFFIQFSRDQLVSVGAYKVWRFHHRQEMLRWSEITEKHRRLKSELSQREIDDGKNEAVDGFDRRGLLYDAGVLEWVFYLAEDDGKHSPLIHPVLVERGGKVDWAAPESEIGAYAVMAGMFLEGCSYQSEAQHRLERLNYEMILPAERILRKVQLVAIPRLRYRAKTSNAARWLADLHEQAPAYIEGYRSIIAQSGDQAVADAEAWIADFNVGSTVLQRRVQRDINDPLESTIHVLPPNGYPCFTA